MEDLYSVKLCRFIGLQEEMINIKDQQEIILRIAKEISKSITVYAIGGTAMMFLGLKDSTLDIDLVFVREEDRRVFRKAVNSLGYENMDPTIVYGKNDNSPDMVKLPDSKIDLFLNEVISFTFSENMRARAKETHRFDKNLFIKVADVHDLIIMKCATNRAKDEDDILAIIRNSNIDWNILVREIKYQLSLGKEQAIFSLGAFLEKLKNKHKIKVPKVVLDELWNLLKKQVKEKRGR